MVYFSMHENAQSFEDTVVAILVDTVVKTF